MVQYVYKEKPARGREFDPDQLEAFSLTPAEIQHTLLDALVHTDTEAHVPSLGDLIIGKAGSKWGALAIGSSGQVPTVTGGTLVYATPSAGGGIATIAHARAGYQGLFPGGTDVTATFDEEVIDTDDMIDLVGAPQQVTITKAGYYAIIARAAWENQTGTNDLNTIFTNIVQSDWPYPPTYKAGLFPNTGGSDYNDMEVISTYRTCDVGIYFQIELNTPSINPNTMRVNGVDLVVVKLHD